jgi:hypothetical protein
MLLVTLKCLELCDNFASVLKFILFDFYVATGETLPVMNMDSYDTSSSMFKLCHTVSEFSTRNTGLGNETEKK